MTEQPARSRPGRTALVERATAETRVRVELDLDGAGRFEGATGVGFLDHMLASLARHALFDLRVSAQGDLHVDSHHTVEDTGLCLGQALDEALGDRSGVARFGDAAVPMDETWVLAAVDLSGRPYLGWSVPGLQAPGARLGEMEAELVREFFRAFASTGRLALHVRELSGGNLHHLAEACFKAVAVALGRACQRDPRRAGSVPSTKGVL